MDERRFKCILSGPSRYELTFMEKRFIELAKYSLEKEGRLTEQQECMLEGLYVEQKQDGLGRVSLILLRTPKMLLNHNLEII